MVKVGITPSLLFLLVSSKTVLAGDNELDTKTDDGLGYRIQAADDMWQPRVMTRMERRIENGLLRRAQELGTTTVSSPLITTPTVLPPSLHGGDDGIHARQDDGGEGQDNNPPGFGKEHGKGKGKGSPAAASTSPPPPPPAPVAPGAPPVDPASISASLTSIASLANSSAVSSPNASAAAALSSLSTKSSQDVATASQADATAASQSLGAQFTVANSAAAAAQSQVVSLSASVASISSSLAASISAAASSALASASSSVQQLGTAAATTSPGTNQAGNIILTIPQVVGILVGTVVGTVITTLLLAWLANVLIIRRTAARQSQVYNNQSSPTSEPRLHPGTGKGYPRDEKEQFYSQGAIRANATTPRFPAYLANELLRRSRRLDVFDEKPLSGGDTAGFSFDGLRFGDPTHSGSDADGGEALKLKLSKQSSNDGNPTVQVVRQSVDMFGQEGAGRGPSRALTYNFAAYSSAVAESKGVPSSNETATPLASPSNLNPPSVPPSAGLGNGKTPTVSWGTWEAGLAQQRQRRDQAEYEEQPLPTPNHMAFLLAQPPKGHIPKYSQSTTQLDSRNASPASTIAQPVSPQRSIAPAPVSPPPQSPLPLLPISAPPPSTRTPTPPAQLTADPPPKRQRAPVPAPLQRFLPGRLAAQLQAPTSLPGPTSAPVAQNISPITTPRQATFSLFPNDDSPRSLHSVDLVNRQLASMYTHKRSSSSVGPNWPVSQGLDSEFSTLSPRSADSDGRALHMRDGPDWPLGSP